MPTNQELKELKRQCEIRNLPYEDVKYLVDSMIAERDKRLVERVEVSKYPPKELEYDENTYNHGYNNACDDFIEIIKTHE